MARFILDIHSENGELTREEVMEMEHKILEFIISSDIGNGIASIYPMDLTNDNQFSEIDEENHLTQKQIDFYHSQLGYKP